MVHSTFQKACLDAVKFDDFIYEDVLVTLLLQWQLFDGMIDEVAPMPDDKAYIHAVPIVQQTEAAIATVCHHQAERIDFDVPGRRSVTPLAVRNTDIFGKKCLEVKRGMHLHGPFLGIVGPIIHGHAQGDQRGVQQLDRAPELKPLLLEHYLLSQIFEQLVYENGVFRVGKQASACRKKLIFPLNNRAVLC